MKAISVPVEKTGRIMLPVKIRRRLQLVPGKSQVLISLDEDSNTLYLTTLDQALERIQQTVRRYVAPGSDVVGEFLADKRAESAREDGK